jgi:hypothetical protein
MTQRIVTFKTTPSTVGTYVLINGEIKGYISAGPERYISITNNPDKLWTNTKHGEREVVARFRTNQPMLRAKAFCKTVLSHLDIPTVIELVVNERMPPSELVKKIENGELMSVDG